MAKMLKVQCIQLYYSGISASSLSSKERLMWGCQTKHWFVLMTTCVRRVIQCPWVCARGERYLMTVGLVLKNRASVPTLQIWPSSCLSFLTRITWGREGGKEVLTPYVIYTYEKLSLQQTVLSCHHRHTRSPHMICTHIRYSPKWPALKVSYLFIW